LHFVQDDQLWSRFWNLKVSKLRFTAKNASFSRRTRSVAVRGFTTIELQPPEATNRADPPRAETIERRDLLGGLIHEYHPAAA